MTLQQLDAFRDQIKKEMSATYPDLDKVGELLTHAKFELAGLGAFVPVIGKTDPNVMVAARDILEAGAYHSVLNKDIPSFERYIAQLGTYYNDLSTVLPPSTQMYPLIGVNLLCLLSQNRLSDFHTALESISPDELQNNTYIKQAVDLEQFLMEGSYNKVFGTKDSVKGAEFMFFYDILISTIRSEIASCCEKAYDYLPMADAATLLFLRNTEEIFHFSTNRLWKINPTEQKVYFKSNDTAALEIPEEQILTRTLYYARELERIV